jgi:undecaprenyl diphosphate synthase
MSDEIPRHVAIIPDGNRRWARARGLPGTAGHAKAGSYNHLNAIFQEGKKMGVRYMSLWGFSTENWKREESEKKKLFDIFLKGADKLLEVVEKEKFGFMHIGRKDRLPKELIEKFEVLEEKAKNYRDCVIIFCIDYGGRDEILRAVNKAVAKGKEVDEESFSKLLDTSDIPDPDLIIRTSGEKRMSGFMPFQGTYAELYFTEKHFPEFGPKEFREAVDDYLHRKRTFGGN